MSEVFESDELCGNLMASCRTEELNYRWQLDSVERKVMKHIIEQEKKGSGLLMSLFESMGTPDYANILKKLAPKK